MIFSRRSIQRFINCLGCALSSSEIDKLVSSLNRSDRSSLDYEWEVAVLYALSELGELSYETSHGGDSFPDVTFMLHGRKAPSFVAEISTVSDRGLDEENPIQILSNFLHQKARLIGLNGGFSYRVEGDVVGKEYTDRKVKLAIPHKKEIREFLERNLTPRLREIKRNNESEADLSIHEDPYHITIQYRDNARSSSGGNLSYTAAYSLTKNPLYTSLKSKTRQLNRSKFNGSRGIILCDGGCDLIKSRYTGGMSYSSKDVISDFLRQNSSISFVMTLWIENPKPVVFGQSKQKRILRSLILNPTARYPLDLCVVELMERIPEVLPIPISDGYNAARKLELGQYRDSMSFYGGSEMSLNEGLDTIRISSRALLQLLSNDVTANQFERDHWSRYPYDDAQVNNPFRWALDRGLMINNITVERQEDKDDDWLIFELSGPDVALKKFHCPE